MRQDQETGALAMRQENETGSMGTGDRARGQEVRGSGLETGD
jgi:hypothetical protein